MPACSELQLSVLHVMMSQAFVPHHREVLAVAVMHRRNRVSIFDPVTRPDQIRSLRVVKQILDNGSIVVSVTCHETQPVQWLNLQHRQNLCF